MNQSEASIIIPNVSLGQTIWDVISNLFSVIYDTEQLALLNNANVIWDFSNLRELHPIYVAGLAVLNERFNKRVCIKNIPCPLEPYLSTAYFQYPFEIQHPGYNWSQYYDKDYVPICTFNPNNKTAEYVQDLVQNTIKHQLGSGLRFHSVLSLILGELIDNITDHAKCDKGYLFCQQTEDDRMLVLIADTGHSIYSSYATDARYRDVVTENESSALSLALSGKSTKNRPENENRGYGISKSRKIIVEALGGEFYVLSGGALYVQTPFMENIADLPDAIRWDGTTVIMNIPVTVPENFNIYPYIS